MAGTPIDGNLAAQLAKATKSNEPMQAWFRLSPTVVDENWTKPDRNEQVARELVERVRRKLGQVVASVNVQKMLGTFTVVGPPSLLKGIMSEPEIVQAGATNV